MKQKKTGSNLRNACFPVMVLALLAAATAFGQEVISPGAKLDLAQCIQIALDHLPAVRSARASEEVSRSLVRQAESAYYPQVSWTSSIGRSYFGLRTSSGITRASGTYNSYSTGVNLSQNVFDFGRTPTQVRIQKLDESASRADFETAAEQAAFGVKQSYFGVLQAKRNKDAADEAVKQYELHLEQAKGQYDVGLQPKYDVTKATVDLGNAKVSLIKAQNAVRLAVASLNNAMGVTETLDYEVVDNLSFEAVSMTFEEALAAAFAKKPDLLAARTRRQAAESSLSLAKKGYWPTLSGSGSFSYSGNSFPLSRSWSVGLSLDIPVFNGFLTAAQVSGARANLDIARASEDTQKLAVYLAVQQAYLNLKSAEELVPVSELNVTAAQENFDIADASYREGVGDPIQVADAAAALVSAKVAYVQALYDCKVARASLELAMGNR